MPYHRCTACGLTTYSAAAHSSARVCPNCSADLSEDSRLYLTRGTDCTAGRILAARPESVGEARRVVATLPLPAVAREDLALIVSELVTNAVLHSDGPSGGPVSLDITVRAGHARVTVKDGGSGFAASEPLGGDLMAAGGQGLVIVSALSESWSVDRGPDGCTVRCEVAIEDEPAAMGRRVTDAYVRQLALEMARPAVAAPG